MSNLYIPYTLGGVIVIAIILLGILIQITERNEREKNRK